MFYNHLKVAIRTIWRQKGLSFINLVGLSVGIGCFSLFLLYAINEFSFNRFHQNKDRIYQVVVWRQPVGNQTEVGSGTFLPMPLGPAMESELPGVEKAVRYKPSWKKSFVRAHGQLSQAGVTLVDTSFLSVFSFPLIEGEIGSALDDPYKIVLTEKTADRLFGDRHVIGEQLQIKLEDRFETYTVGGVVKDIPSNSSLQFEILSPFSRYLMTDNGKSAKDEWNWSNGEAFVMLHANSDLAGLDGPGVAKLQDFYNRHFPEEEAFLRKEGLWTGVGAPSTYRLMPMDEMHMGKAQWLNAAEMDPEFIWMLLSIAAGVLLIACINFTTLSIGRSAGRAQEVGVRKVLGSNRNQLVRQFLAEALLMSIFSAGLGLTLAQLALPWFNTLADRSLQFSLQLYPEIGWLIIGLILLVGLLAGAYPSAILSGFRPVAVLKSKLRLGGLNFFSKGLVTTQFVLSVGLAISTAIILQQVHYMQTQNPGFQKENVLVVKARETNAAEIYPKFRQLAMQNPDVLSISSAEMSFGQDEGYALMGWEYHDEQKETYQYIVDTNFVAALGMDVVAGSNFQPGMGQDRVIINEAFAHNFGWTADEAVGKTIDGYNDTNAPPLVQGVVRDFHFRSFREKVEPQLFLPYQPGDAHPYQFFIRLRPGDPASALTALNKNWKQIEPDLPFNYSFLDEDLNRFYQSESRLGKIIGWAGGIAIFLACLGLLGLVALAVVNRTKEIGIRKVLGASELSIVELLSKDFLRLVAVAVIIASPVSWYLMHNWLQGFAYHITMPWWIFVSIGAFALAIAFLTISFHGVRAAVANPVDSLRNE